MNEIEKFLSTLDGKKQIIFRQILSLPESEQEAIFSALAQQECAQSKKYPLIQLMNRKPVDLLKSKPRRLWINNVSLEVKSWKEVDIYFVKTLISQNLLQKKDLPFYPNSASGKAFINSVPHHPIRKYEGNFVKVEDGFYVDYKYNAPKHIQNIGRTLEKLGLLEKWTVEFGFKDYL